VRLGGLGRAPAQHVEEDLQARPAHGIEPEQQAAQSDTAQTAQRQVEPARAGGQHQRQPHHAGDQRRAKVRRLDQQAKHHGQHQPRHGRSAPEGPRARTDAVEPGRQQDDDAHLREFAGLQPEGAEGQPAVAAVGLIEGKHRQQSGQQQHADDNL